MIEKETIERIKTSVDLKSLVESRGIELKKNGKGWFGLCPFHDDKTPSLSVTPSKNEWHCFGCGAGGDVIRFVEMFDRVDFKEAVKRLGGSDVEKTAVKIKKEDPGSETDTRPYQAVQPGHWVLPRSFCRR